MAPPELLTVFVTPLEDTGVEYMVTGSVAAIVYGRPRLTNDVDIVLHIGRANVRAFVQAFPAEQFYCPPPEVIGVEVARDRRGHFNLIHHDTGFKADCYPVGADPLHRWALANRRRIEAESENPFWCAPPEYVILRKLEFYREGMSTKHVEDIRAMLTESGDRIDTSLLEQKVAELRIGEEWRQVLEGMRE